MKSKNSKFVGAQIHTIQRGQNIQLTVVAPPSGNNAALTLVINSYSTAQVHSIEEDFFRPLVMKLSFLQHCYFFISTLCPTA